MSAVDRIGEAGGSAGVAGAGGVEPRALGEPGGTGTRDIACTAGCGKVVRQTWLVAFGPFSRAGWHPISAKCEDCRGLTAADQQAADEVATRALAERERTRAGRVAALAVPALYREATIRAFKEHGTAEEREVQRTAKARCFRFVAGWDGRQNLPAPAIPLLVVLYGPPGVGKTMLAYAVARALVEEQGATALVVKFPDLVRDVRGAWDRAEGGMSEAKRLARYRVADLLVIDEVSTHALSGDAEGKRQHLYDVIAWREEQMRPTIITTNETGEASLTTVLGTPLLSRALRYDGLWCFGWGDYRDRLHKSWVKREKLMESAAGDGGVK